MGLTPFPGPRGEHMAPAWLSTEVTIERDVLFLKLGLLSSLPHGGSLSENATKKGKEKEREIPNPI